VIDGVRHVATDELDAQLAIQSGPYVVAAPLIMPGAQTI
jgi:hypothetical protein